MGLSSRADHTFRHILSLGDVHVQRLVKYFDVSSNFRPGNEECITEASMQETSLAVK